MEWLLANFGHVLSLAGLHLYQSVLPLALGVLISVPLAQLARLNKTVKGFLLSAGSVLYTIPSLALFVILPVVLGTRILDLTNVIVALTIYAVALLVRSTVDALNSIDDGIRQAAVAVGYRPLFRFLTVDLPLSLPVLFAGLRVISVSNISLVSVGALIGIDSFGTLFTDGLRRDFLTEIVVGIIGTLLLALLMDALLVLLQRILTPWVRAVPPSTGPGARILAVTADPDGAAAVPAEARAGTP
ncbi:ABC transporter permease subunit [Paenarthrobacter sp. Z7-10]|uniref:ABC transporter permease n=1 Tax=Paenarthrobacter sp. Z7-10 TaxID=2787635 RepID=UPI0022A94FE3|nr:ABC transporter permease subunit [Paenarthrobacter sp. Z7-10]MCZ2403283.1 ABC transporter permease subunit [Paenarthrobacter sp. Z7-10]